MDRTLERVALIADDLGRLKRMGEPNHVLERLACHVDTLDAMLRPTAADLCRQGMPALHALGWVDRERRELRHRLGLEHI